MKKLLAIMIVATMMLCLSVSAFADYTSTSQNVTAYYEIPETFTVTIPTEVQIGGNYLKISANTAKICPDNALYITVTSSNYDFSQSKWAACCNDNSLHYSITQGGIPVGYNNPFLGFAHDEEVQDIYLAFEANQSELSSALPGRYTDFLTFGFAIGSNS